MSVAERVGRARQKTARALTRIVPWLASSMVALWTLVLLTDLRGGATRDWSHFYATARTVLAWRIDEIYPGPNPKLPFLHPPYLVWPLVPFGLATRAGGYLAFTASTLLAMALALALLRRVLPGDRRRFAIGAVVVLASASWTVTLSLGQLSAWFLLLLCAGLLLWMRERRMWAGAVLALMMCKPNLGAVFPIIFLARRQWPLFAGWLAAFVLLVCSTLPLGAGVWTHYAASMRSVSTIIAAIPPWRQHTMLAFWRSLLGGSRWLVPLWIASVLPLVAVTGWAWLRTDLDARHLPRLFGVTVLMLVTCSPYLHHYDALIVALPGLVWFLDRDSYRSARLRRICGAALLIAFVTQQVSIWIVERGWSLVGPALALWLVADAVDLADAPRALAHKREA